MSTAATITAEQQQHRTRNTTKRREPNADESDDGMKDDEEGEGEEGEAEGEESDGRSSDGALMDEDGEDGDGAYDGSSVRKSIVSASNLPGRGRLIRRTIPGP